MTETRRDLASRGVGTIVVVRDRAPLLPKIAFTLIAVASLLGTALTNRGLGLSPALLVPRWLSLWVAAAVVGFVAWRLVYLRTPRAGSDPAASYHADLARRAGGVGRLLAPPALVTLPAALTAGYLGARPGVLLVLLLGGTLLAAALVVGVHDARGAATAGAAALAVTVAWALGDAGIGAAGALRVLHLLAFGLWVGGATWNLAVAIPVGRRHPTVEAVVSGAEQLQRFRRVARVALVTVVVTGVAMALPYLASVADLTGTVAGRFITAKVSLIVALVVIFVTCPMFRQCSPVSGVCDLDELDDGPQPLPRERVGATAEVRR
jgi:uncharacterized membrane protein